MGFFFERVQVDHVKEEGKKMHCLLVLAMLSLSTSTAVLYNEDTGKDKGMMPGKDLMWKEGKGEKKDLLWNKEMGERRSEPPSYMFHLLEQFSKEGRGGFARSILPMKGDGPSQPHMSIFKIQN